MTDAERNREIADGYIEAALFTAGVDSAPGEYQADPDKVASLAVFGANGVADWIAAMEPMGNLEELEGQMDARRIGHCVHYAREGHGVSFLDEFAFVPDDGHTPFHEAQEVAQGLGADDDLMGAIMDRFPGCELAQG